MRRGDRSTIEVDGEKIEAEFVGAGHYCKAFRAGDRVFCFVVEEEFMKDCIAEMCPDGPHVPAIKKRGKVFRRGKWFKVYEMPFYPNLTAKDADAWAAYKVLRATADEVFRRLIAKGSRLAYDGAYFNRDVIEESRGKVPESVTEALEDMADAACNYGCGVSFEFAPRNLGVDGEGRIVFRDILFDAEKLERERQQKMRAHRGY